jgi:glutamate N-acetyltransferase / amino-acid N-acetyltransferase
VSFHTPISYPPHERMVELEVDLGLPGGKEGITVLGSDLTHEYVSVNADYRS